MDDSRNNHELVRAVVAALEKRLTALDLKAVRITLVESDSRLVIQLDGPAEQITTARYLVEQIVKPQ